MACAFEVARKRRLFSGMLLRIICKSAKTFTMKIRLMAMASSVLLGTASPASTRWMEARSANFILYSEGSEKALRQSIVLLEDYDRLLRTLTGTNAPPSRSPLKVYLVDSPAKMQQVADVPPRAAGF